MLTPTPAWVPPQWGSCACRSTFLVSGVLDEAWGQPSRPSLPRPRATPHLPTCHKESRTKDRGCGQGQAWRSMLPGCCPSGPTLICAGSSFCAQRRHASLKSSGLPRPLWTCPRGTERLLVNDSMPVGMRPPIPCPLLLPWAALQPLWPVPGLPRMIYHQARSAHDVLCST